jgi:hypothetical protein
MLDDPRRAAAAENLPKARTGSAARLERQVSPVRRRLEMVVLVILLAFIGIGRCCPALQPLPAHPARSVR